MNFRTAVSGQPVRIRADVWNAMQRVAKEHLSSEEGGAGVPQLRMPRDVVYVKNVSDTDVPQFGILGIQDILFAPTDNLPEFKYHFALCGATPDIALHRGKFVVCLEPIVAATETAQAGIGRALLVGVTPCKVDVQNEADAWADIADGDNAKLKSGPTGAAQILYKESGTGEKWAIVRLGNRGERSLFPVLVSKDGGSAGDEDNPCTYTYTVTDLAGTITYGTGMSPAKPRTSKGAMVYQSGTPAYGTGFWDNDQEFVLWDAGEVFQVAVCEDLCEEEES
jgi:hypothetical protein